jgi:hypothetical protein
MCDVVYLGLQVVLETMIVILPRLRHTTCHRRRMAMKRRTRSTQIRPTGSGLQLWAYRHSTATSQQDLQLNPRLRPAPLLHLLWMASPPARASDWPGVKKATLKGGRSESLRERRKGWTLCIKHLHKETRGVKYLMETNSFFDCVENSLILHLLPRVSIGNGVSPYRY